MLNPQSANHNCNMQHSKIFSHNFSEKIWINILCETIHMKFQALFPLKMKIKRKIRLWPAAAVSGALWVNILTITWPYNVYLSNCLGKHWKLISDCTFDYPKIASGESGLPHNHKLKTELQLYYVCSSAWADSKPHINSIINFSVFFSLIISSFPSQYSNSMIEFDQYWKWSCIKGSKHICWHVCLSLANTIHINKPL